MSTRYSDPAGVDEAGVNAAREPETVSGAQAEHGGAGTTLVSSLLYGTLALVLTCGPLLIPGVGLGAALMWIVAGGTLVFLGLLIWGVIRSFRDVSATGGRRRKR